jgi:Domain of unknown function (DUF4189)
MFFAVVTRAILMLAGGMMLAFFIQIPLALADCPQGEGSCPQNMGGGCAPMGSVCCPGGTHVASGGTCAAEQPGDWGAAAVVEWKDSSGGAHVATGVASGYKTISLASSAALTSCQTDAGGKPCQIVGTFSNGGCGYIAVGKGTNDVRWGMGDSAQKALSECTAIGETCQTPIGYCTKAN